MATNDQNMRIPAPKSNALRPKKSIDKKRRRTPSPTKNQRRFPEDAYSPDDDDATPRQGRFARDPYPVPILPYKEALSMEHIEDDDDDDDQARSPTRSPTRSTRSHTQSQSSNRSASPKKTTSLWIIGNGVNYTSLAIGTAARMEQLGGNGLALLKKLDNVDAVVPAQLKQALAEADVGELKEYQFDKSDERPVDELRWELRTIQDINSLSHRCSRDRDHEAEWNNRVHTKVLELALGNDETRVGFRGVTAAKITAEYRPTHPNGLTAGNTTGKIVDYAINLEPSGPARDVIASLVGMSTDSINHVGYEGLRTRPIAISIETKTESRTVEEAKVQLGVWVAAQVARIESLAAQLAAAKKAAEAGTGPDQPQAQQSTASPSAIRMPDPSDVLSQTVFPLIDIQSDTWSLFFARVTPSNAAQPSHPGIRKPASNIQVFHSVPLGTTSSTVQTYRLVKSLRVLRNWVDTDFRGWWDGFLGLSHDEAGGA